MSRVRGAAEKAIKTSSAKMFEGDTSAVNATACEGQFAALAS